MTDQDMDPQTAMQRNKDKRELKLAQDAFRDFVSTEGGRIYLRNLGLQCCVMQQTFTGNSQTFFSEGQRSVVDGMLKETAKVNPDAFAKIMKDILT